MKILFIGDVVGKAGRDFLTHNLNKIRNQYSIDFCIANGENSAHGKSITTDVFFQLSNAGVDFITMGNHTFNRNVEKVFDNSDNISSIKLLNKSSINFYSVYHVSHNRKSRH